jgi:hypothetical protein
MKVLNILLLLITFQLYFVSINSKTPGVKEIADKYCIDSDEVSVDAIVKIPNGTIYAFIGNLFTKTDLIAANGLPIIDPDSPNLIESFGQK